MVHVVEGGGVGTLLGALFLWPPSHDKTTPNLKVYPQILGVRNCEERAEDSSTSQGAVKMVKVSKFTGWNQFIAFFFVK